MTCSGKFSWSISSECTSPPTTTNSGINSPSLVARYRQVDFTRATCSGGEPVAVVGFSGMAALSQELLAQLYGRLRRSFRMILQIQIYLHRMNAADAFPVSRSVENAFVVGHDQPDMLASFFLVEADLLPHLGGRDLPHVENHQPKPGK